MKSDPASRIVRIDGYELSAQLRVPMRNSLQSFERRGALYLAMTTAGGQTGWGETWAFPAVAGEIIRSDLGPRLIGKDVTAPRPLHEMMLGRLGIDRRGLTHMAISALDIAVWDLAGRHAGVPLHALLGGAIRSTIPAYSSGPFMINGPEPYKNFPSEIDRYLKAGFRAFKIRTGTTPRQDGEMARRIREQVGPDILFMADYNQGTSFNNALEVMTRFAEADVLWLEEPLIFDDLDGYRRLRERAPIALAGGKSLVGLRHFREFLEAGAFDIVQPDLALCGGITEGLKIAALAEAYDVPVALHIWGGLVNFYASLQFAAILPENRRRRWPCPIFEYDFGENPLRTLLGEYPLDKAGHVVVPDRPGLGLDLDPKSFEPYLVKKWTVQ